jgi:hypothetical protein
VVYSGHVGDGLYRRHGKHLSIEGVWGAFDAPGLVIEEARVVSLPGGQKLATLFISPYQKRISSKAPRGLSLADLSFGPT